MLCIDGSVVNGRLKEKIKDKKVICEYDTDIRLHITSYVGIMELVKDT